MESKEESYPNRNCHEDWHRVSFVDQLDQNLGNHRSEENKWISRLLDDRKNIENGNKLRLYRLYKERIAADPYVTQNMPRHYRQIVARFRCGSFPIHVETGRFEKIPLNERHCVFCTGDFIIDEKHVLPICELYNDLRYE